MNESKSDSNRTKILFELVYTTEWTVSHRKGWPVNVIVEGGHLPDNNELSDMVDYWNELSLIRQTF